MYELLVIGYDTLPQAEAARTDLLALSNRYLVDVADAVVATREPGQPIRIEHLVDLWPVGLSGRAIWGTLAAVLQRHPLCGGPAGAPERLHEFGLEDAFMSRVARLLEQRGGALLVLARRSGVGHVLDCLHRSGEAVLCSDIHRPQALEMDDPAGLGRHRSLAA
ncbi:DUF1269 domain-containing protein [Nitrogeniibacter mangrovi]|uniref:DUF1269 domain-containing protein n=1 Tax=Nitrogeniibacter mangrovi TaxID=2016596 RepID=A0A6C1B2I2_9RHOO|nr:DUF1269 domain-containing protein [Nitrogeniibacter mangrovi]QID16414.1 DUF1269 domain-containing protein [Nitrogeniibacter mangrovi]